MIATLAACGFACTTVVSLAGWWSTTLVVRREIRRAVMAEAKYRAVFEEFIDLV